MLFEQRSVTVVPEDLWRNARGGGATPTGITITPENALNSTTVFQAIRFLSFMLASLPLITYQKSGEDRQRATKHPLYYLLHDQPNEEMTSFDLISLLASHVFGRGNGLAEIVYGMSGQVEALWPLRVDRVQLVRNTNYELRYIVTLPEKFGSEQRVLRPEQVWHLRGLTKEGLWGLSVLAMHRNAVALAQATEQYGSAYFGNGAEPGVVLKHPGTLDDDVHDRITESWEQAHMGLNQAHRAAILEEGMSIEKIGFNPQDSQFLETRKFQVIEVARMFGIPPHLLFELSNATFTNIEQQSLELLKYHLRPWLVSFEQQIKRSLLLERERKAGYYSEFLVDAIERGDLSTRFTAYVSGLGQGVFTINDVLRKENMNTIGKMGDSRLVPMNMAVLGADGMPIPSLNQPKNPPTAARNQEFEDHPERRNPVFKPLFLDAAERILKRETNELTNVLKRFEGRSDKLNTWLDEFYKRDYPEFMQLVIKPLIRARLLTEEQADSLILSYCARRGHEFKSLIDGTIQTMPTVADETIANQLAGESHD
jgi:HK97 family phage portal protein